MDVRAIILVGGADSPSHEEWADNPMALLDVLGAPTLIHTIERLRAHAVPTAAVIGRLGTLSTSARRSLAGMSLTDSTDTELWREAENAFTRQVQDGAEFIVLVRLGCYAELDYSHLVRVHVERAAKVTSVFDNSGQALDSFVISGQRRNDAAYLLRSRLKSMRNGCVHYTFGGYVNRLQTPADLRLLTIAAFSGEAQLRPIAREVKPGVWVGERARIQRGARLLAPCFIGDDARVRANSVVGRCSTVERHAIVDCGTVLDNASILPHTTVGAGLDIANAIVGFRRLAHLVRQAEIEISDPKLISVRAAAPVRTLRSAFSLASFLPVQMIRGLRARKEKAIGLPEAVQTPSPALKQGASLHEAEEVAAPFIVARRYGND